ncbi:4Fe-4S dicluster domain-containing protein [Clostridium felsineum]|uniref:Na(+)-translocating ferredoxin:NAD(+) oxidoreductase complex subunit C n=1 Tax=Clostridium felsineum TaxID=36839 RepID=A0A1S8M9J2_9CLOT|nr:4Fe-4S dicluster domain-containing protein [Clostridium felsineum]URZ08442.1 Na(+)-translocating ferredoxin:NAD(+) oxidoreductase complex subunit C [Clostridium felsineum]URZ13473.1 Na(+)-translocating ferredoxin:NAD(+) oxidoreductase complex subunit C [Clostridium felsineum]
MNNYPIITKKKIKSNNEVKRIQKENKKKYGRRMLFGYPKASIPKIVIENGCIDMVGNKSQSEIQAVEANKLLEAIEKNELTGMSGNGFATYKKIKVAIAAPGENKVIIVNGAECDPGLTHDAWLIRNRLNDIIFGSKLLAQMLHTSKVFLAAKLLKNEVIEGINVKNLPNRYPTGAEKVLIKEVLDMEMDKNEIPVKKGILVINVQTVIMIAEIAKGEFLKGSRYITVADYETGEAKVARVNYDMDVKEVLEKVFGDRKGKAIFTGGGIMAAHKAQENEKVTPLTNFIGYSKEVTYNNESKCKKCRGCTKNCPMGIQVHKVIGDQEKNIKTNMKSYGVEDCINCGSCTFLCMAGKNTMEIVNMNSK